MTVLVMQNNLCSNEDASSKKVISSSARMRLSFLRKYFGIILAEFILITFLTSISMLTPLVRFYVNENDWIFPAVCILFVASYFLLLLQKDKSFIVYLLVLHIVLQALTVAIIAVSYDMLAILQGAVLTSGTFLFLLLYTLLSDRDFNLWIAFVISCVCILLAARSLQAYSGSSHEEIVTSILLAVIILFYYLYVGESLMKKHSSDEYFEAIVNMYVRPFQV